jgi:hypothetical protein
MFPFPSVRAAGSASAWPAPKAPPPRKQFAQGSFPAVNVAQLAATDSIQRHDLPIHIVPQPVHRRGVLELESG